MIGLGVRAKCKITGFEGTVVSRVQHITGCDRYSLQPDAKDGKMPDAIWFDETVLEITDADVKFVDPRKTVAGPVPG